MYKWNTTAPPKRKTKPVTIRFRSLCGEDMVADRSEPNCVRLYWRKARPRQGQFVWSVMESSFLQVTQHMDPDGGIGLYSEDYEILGWKP